MRNNIPSRDLFQKLNGTICCYKGIPYHVEVPHTERTINEIFLTHIYDSGVKTLKISPDDPEFDISNLPLGFMKSNSGHVYYLSRPTVRRTRQGTDSRWLRVTPLVPGVNPAYKAGDLVYSKGFYDSVMGNFTPLRENLENLRKFHKQNPAGNHQSVINRNIAMWIDAMGRINVHYKEEFVGWIQPDKFTVHVPNSDKAFLVSKYLSAELGWEID